MYVVIIVKISSTYPVAHELNKYEEIIQLHNSTAMCIKQLGKKLVDQQYLLAEKKVPRKYFPPHNLHCDDVNILRQFDESYKELFFKHLASVITANQISLQIKRAQLTNLQREMERTLLNDSKQSIEYLQKQFLLFIEQTKMDNYTPSPALQQILQLSSVTTPSLITTVKDSPQTTQHNRKRTSSDHPKADKRIKIKNHFLGKGHSNNHHPT